MDTAPGPVPVNRALKKPTHRVRALQLRSLRSFLHSEPPSSCRCTQRACNNIVQARIRRAPKKLLDLRTGTSKTLSMSCNWGISMVRRTAWTVGNRLCATTKMTRRFSQRAATVGARMSSPQCTTGKSATMSSNWGISFVRQQSEPWLREDRDVNDLRRTAAAVQRHFQTVYTVWTTAPVKHTITLSRNCTCEIETKAPGGGPADNEVNTARTASASKTSKKHATAAVGDECGIMSPYNCPAGHTDHAAEHDDNRRERSAKCIITSKTSHTTVVDDERGHFLIGEGRV